MLRYTEEVGRREEKLSTDKALDDYEHNRILASHAAHGGRAAPAPQNRFTSAFFQESEDEDGMAIPSSLEEVGRLVRGAAGSCGVRSSRSSPLRSGKKSPLGGRVGVGSPLGSPLGQRSPLDSPLGRFRRCRRGNQGIDNALQEEPQEPPRRNEYGHNSYESQEALVQILGLPSQTHLAEMAKASTSTPAAQAVALAAAVNTTTGAIVTGTTPTVLTSVNTALATAATTLSITVVAPVTAPSDSQVSTATAAVTSVVQAAVPGAAPATGTGTGSTSISG